MRLLSTLAKNSLHKQVLLLAMPMLFSNISEPLLSLVNVAIIGHLQKASYLGGVALGSTLFSVTFGLLGFLRMSTTGFVAQAYGANNNYQLGLVFLQGICLALVLSGFFLFSYQSVAQWALDLSHASAHITHYAKQYFVIRAWSMPAALGNLVVFGWLLGTQNSKSPMWMVLITNCTNLVLSAFFVMFLGYKVKGVALAATLADYTGLFVGLFAIYCKWREARLPSFLWLCKNITKKWTRLIRLNRDIFLRALGLQATFSFMTFAGASLGDAIVAANTLLMNLLLIVSSAMDGFAYTMEALVGKNIGAKNKEQLDAVILVNFFWGGILCLLFTLVFAIAGPRLLSLITSITTVRATALHYLPWLVAMPLVSMWCFLLDGIFVGATQGAHLRNSMFFATAVFFGVFYLARGLGNHGLWLALISFMATRGVSLAIYCPSCLWRRNAFSTQ